MKNNLLLSLFICLIAATGCKKDNDAAPLVHLPNKFSVKDSPFGEANYTFDINNRLIEIYQPYGYDNKFNYDGNDRIKEVDTYETPFMNGQTANTLSQKTLYSYSPKLINVINTVYYNGTTTNYTGSIVLDADQRVIRTNDGTTKYATYTYDKAGNIITISNYTGSQLTDLENFTYDDKKSRFHDIVGNSFNHTFLAIFNDRTDIINNILTDTHAYSNITTKIIYTYSYDQDGYPISRTVNNSVGSNFVTNEIFTYIIK